MARRRRSDGPDGLVVIDKPPGWTSHDVVAKSRKLLGTSRVGHAGTLDPDATGVLVLGVGRVTRLLRFLSVLGKSYEAEIVLGVETDTLDAAGKVTATHDMGEVDIAEVLRVAATLTGAIEQVPPMVSAVKIDGKRLHELARAGIEVERAPRPVTVHRFTVEPVPGEPLVLRAEVDCSSGTYVRTLAADLGRGLGGGAHLRSLRRTRVGSFTLDEAIVLDALTPEVLLAPTAAVRDLPSVVVDPTVAADVRHGKVLPLERIAPVGDAEDIAVPPPAWAVLEAADGSLLAVYEPHRSGTAKPSVVIAPAST